MSAPLSPGPDSLQSKTDAELLFLAQNPSFYHPDLVRAARQELARRGVALPVAPAPETAQATDEPDDVPPRRWQLPALLLGLLGLAAALYWWPVGNKNWKNKLGPVPKRELVAVPTHVLPSFDSLTTAQLGQMPATLPTPERRDTTAQRKFLLLARRFWEAENQSDYLYQQALAARIDSTFPGQVDLTLDKWRRLTSVLVYDHKLQPTMSARVASMHHAALVRRETLTTMKGLYLSGRPPLDQGLMYFNDSVTVLRQALLGVPAARRIRPMEELRRRVEAEEARQASPQV
ncbi:hypothetical protein E5K00_19530 [Hymenobacter aquaticus]|uniref:Uncharacterized protein n=1 Tax=Hymenobacter aquaticus TaxID=1867101 RepID=A0A4Z0Q0Z5_9BACT|nr:hypothetical protein [Hymenobacter aquaticus]TGE22432.1 hypothetical protein E5K00_19530 [Hymenobacter aquaticus]